MIRQKVKLVTYGVTTYVYLPRWWVKLFDKIEGDIIIDAESKVTIHLKGVHTNNGTKKD